MKEIRDWARANGWECKNGYVPVAAKQAYWQTRPPEIAEADLSVTVIELVKAGQFTDAAKAIEIACRRAYQVEAAR